MTLKNVMVQKGRSKFCLKLKPKKICNISDVIFKMVFLNISRATKAVPFPHDTLLHLQGCEILSFTPRVSPFCFVFFKDWITGFLFFAIFSAFFYRRVLSSLDVIMPNMEIAPYYISATTFTFQIFQQKVLQKPPPLIIDRKKQPGLLTQLTPEIRGDFTLNNCLNILLMVQKSC